MKQEDFEREARLLAEACIPMVVKALESTYKAGLKRAAEVCGNASAAEKIRKEADEGQNNS